MFDVLAGNCGEESFRAVWLGYTIAIAGTALSIIGTLVNNLWLDHTFAMWIWLASNPILFVWAVGNRKGYWDGGLSIDALGVMYATFSITNLVGLFLL